MGSPHQHCVQPPPGRLAAAPHSVGRPYPATHTPNPSRTAQYNPSLCPIIPGSRNSSQHPRFSHSFIHYLRGCLHSVALSYACQCTERRRCAVSMTGNRWGTLQWGVCACFPSYLPTCTPTGSIICKPTSSITTDILPTSSSSITHTTAVMSEEHTATANPTSVTRRSHQLWAWWSSWGHSHAGAIPSHQPSSSRPPH
jgi:hypothetical protein